MKKNIKISLLLAVACLFSMSACTPSSQASSSSSSSSSSTSSSSSSQMNALQLTIEEATIEVGATTMVRASFAQADPSLSVTFESLAPTIASIDRMTGQVTGVAEGSATLKATATNGSEASVNVTVIAKAVQALSAQEFGTLLSNDPYTIDAVETKEPYGLSSYTTVGIQKTEQEKILYPIPDDAFFSNGVILDVNALTSADIAPVFTVSDFDAYERLQGAFLLAKKYSAENKKVKLKLSGDYLVDAKRATTTHVFTFADLNDVYVEGKNARIILKIDATDWKGYFQITNSTNFHMQGVTMEYDVPSNLTAIVQSVDVNAKKITFLVDKEFNALCERLITTKKSLRSYVEFDSITNTPRQDGNFVVDGFQGYTLTKKDQDQYEITIEFKGPITRPGKGDFASLQFTQYDASGIVFNNCKNVTIESVTMHHVGGMAFTSGSTENLKVNRFFLIKKADSHSLMTATADGMHFSMMSGEVTITNSIFEYSHDDALNLKHGYYYKVVNPNGQNRQFTLNKITSGMPVPQIGDKISVFNETTFESRNPISGAFTVKSVTGDQTSYLITVEERLSNVAEWGTCRATFLSHTPQFTFKNNLIQNKRNRGILVQVPGAIIENNTFQNVGHGSIQAATSMDVYNEATLPQETTIRNNKFINNCYIKPEPLLGDISIFAISTNASVAPAGTLSNMKIENNFFAKNGNSPISLRGISDTSIEDNFFYECSRTWPSGEGQNCLLSLYNTDSISVTSNYSEYTLDRGLSGLILQGTTSESCVSLVDNYGIEFQKNEVFGPEVTVAKLKKAITIDGSLLDWENAGGTTVEMLAYSDAEGNEIVPATIANDFKVNTFTIAYDDTGIYFAFDIHDNLLNVKTINDFWLGDCVEIFISTITDMPNADMQVYKDRGGVVQAAFAPTWENSGFTTLSSVRTNAEYMPRKNLIQAKIVEKQNGYSGEVLLPFTFAPHFKTAIEEGKRINMAIICADAERTSIKRVQAGNVPHFVEKYKTNTARMPQYLFQ